MITRIPLILISAFVLTICSVSLLQAEHKHHASDAASPLDPIKALAGYWETDDVDPMTGKRASIIYKVTSGGSAVQEILFPGTSHEMVSIYFVQDDHLVMRHYCMLGNQPELRGVATKDGIEFTFQGGNNIHPRRDHHMHSAKFTMIDSDTMSQHWSSKNSPDPNHVEKKMLLRRKG